MSDYNNFVTAVNKIFSILSTMQNNFNNPDNINYIESINEYKDSVIATADKLKKDSNQSKTVEKLDND